MNFGKLNFKNGFRRIAVAAILIFTLITGIALLGQTYQNVQFDYYESIKIKLDNREPVYLKDTENDVSFLDCHPERGICESYLEGTHKKLISDSEMIIFYPNIFKVFWIYIFNYGSLLVGCCIFFFILYAVYLGFEKIICWIIRGFKST